MTYKGYEALVEFDEDAAIFHGEVINTRDVITFQGSSVKELKSAFKDSVGRLSGILCVPRRGSREAILGKIPRACAAASAPSDRRRCAAPRKELERLCPRKLRT